MPAVRCEAVELSPDKDRAAYESIRLMRAAVIGIVVNKDVTFTNLSYARDDVTNGIAKTSGVN